MHIVGMFVPWPTSVLCSCIMTPNDILLQFATITFRFMTLSINRGREITDIFKTVFRMLMCPAAVDLTRNMWFFCEKRTRMGTILQHVLLSFCEFWPEYHLTFLMSYSLPTDHWKHYYITLKFKIINLASIFISFYNLK